MRYNKLLRYYIYHLNHDLPDLVYWGLLLLFCVGVVLLLIWKSHKIGRDIAKLLLAEYTLLVFLLTVVARKGGTERRYNFTPFWTYTEIIDGKETLMTEIIMNVFVFVPIGLLLGYAFRAMNWKLALVCSGLFSIGIEFFQFLLKRGLTEFDDIFHNTIGCMIGYGIYSLFRCGYERIGRKNTAVL